MMTLAQSAGGSPVTISRRISTSGWAASAAVTPSAKMSRSTASAEPAGTRALAASRMTRLSSARISWWIRPTALLSGSSLRKLLEQTSSASLSVWCASVPWTPAHFVEDHGDAGAGQLPGGFRAGEAAADDVNGRGHARSMAGRGAGGNAPACRRSGGCERPAPAHAAADGCRSRRSSAPSCRVPARRRSCRSPRHRSRSPSRCGQSAWSATAGWYRGWHRCRSSAAKSTAFGPVLASVPLAPPAVPLGSLV